MRNSTTGRQTSRMAGYSDAGRSYALRMILLGEAGTGKTCLYHRIKYKTFRDESSVDDQTPQSIITSRQRQYDQYSKQISLSPGTKVTLTVVDTADREKYQSLTAQYYRRTNIVLLVCSLDDEVTLNRLTKWYQEAHHYVDDPDVLYAVCGVKSDLQPHEKEITGQMMRSFAQHMGFSQNYVFEVSSKTGSDVKSMLRTLCTAAIERVQRNISERPELNELEENSALLGSHYSNLESSIGVINNRREHCRCCCCVLL